MMPSLEKDDQTRAKCQRGRNKKSTKVLQKTHDAKTEPPKRALSQRFSRLPRDAHEAQREQPEQRRHVHLPAAPVQDQSWSPHQRRQTGSLLAGVGFGVGGFDFFSVGGGVGSGVGVSPNARTHTSFVYSTLRQYFDPTRLNFWFSPPWQS